MWPADLFGPGALAVTEVMLEREAEDTGMAARGEELGHVLDPLDASERQTLVLLPDKLLTGRYSDIGSADLPYRLCDRRSCPIGAPVTAGRAERDRAG